MPAMKERHFISELTRDKAGISTATTERDSVAQHLLQAFRIGYRVVRYCWSKATALPEALRDGNTNDLSYPDSLNTKKKQLPQMQRNRKYPWVNTEACFQPVLEMERRSEPI